MRRILFNQSFFDNKDEINLLLKFYKIFLETSGFEKDVVDVVRFSLDYYNSNLIFPSQDTLLEQYKDFNFVREEFRDSKNFKIYVKQKEVVVRDKLRKDLVLEYLNCTNSVEERQKILDQINHLEKEIFIDQENLKEISEYRAKDLYQHRKLIGSGPLTNIEDIDAVIGGVTAGKIMTVAAPPKSFKTTFAINFTYLGITKYEAPNNTLFISLEIPPDELYYKILLRSGFDKKINLSIRSILKGTLDEKEEAILYQLEKDFEESKRSELYIMSSADIKLSSITVFTQQLIDFINTKNIRTIVLDYIQLFRNYKVKGYNDPYQFLNDMVGLFRVISVLYDVRVILLSQMNREGYKKSQKIDKNGVGGKFGLNDLAEINALERDSYYIVTLSSSDEMKRVKQLKFQLIAHRDGETIDTPKFTAVVPEYFLVGKNDMTGFKFDSDIMESDIIAPSTNASDGELLNFDFFNS